MKKSTPERRVLKLPPESEWKDVARFRLAFNAFRGNPLIEISFDDGKTWVAWIAYQSIVLPKGILAWQSEVERLKGFFDLNGWPCQDLYGGRMPFLDCDKDGRCKHEPCRIAIEEAINDAESQSAAWRKAWLAAKGEK